MPAQDSCSSGDWRKRYLVEFTFSSTADVKSLFGIELFLYLKSFLMFSGGIKYRKMGRGLRWINCKAKSCKFLANIGLFLSYLVSFKIISF